jgi:hypothetical protein
MKVKFLVSVGGLQFSVGNGADYGYGPGVVAVNAKNAEFLEGEIRCGHAVLLNAPEEKKVNAPINVLPVLDADPPIMGDDSQPKRQRRGRAVQ